MTPYKVGDKVRILPQKFYRDASGKSFGEPHAGEVGRIFQAFNHRVDYVRLWIEFDGKGIHGTWGIYTPDEVEPINFIHHC